MENSWSREPTIATAVLRYRRLFFVALLLGIVLGTAAGIATPRQYVATAEVLIGAESQGQWWADLTPTEAVSGELAVLRSAAVARRAAAQLSGQGEDASAETVSEALAAEHRANSRLIAISFASSTPTSARNGADAVLTAYLELRDEQLRRSSSAPLAVAESFGFIQQIDEVIDLVNEDIAALDAEIASSNDASDLQGLRSRRQYLVLRRSELITRREAAISGIIDPPFVLTHPDDGAVQQTGPSLLLFPAVGMALAAGVAAGTAYVLANRRRVVTDPAAPGRLLGAPCLVALPSAPPNRLVVIDDPDCRQAQALNLVALALANDHRRSGRKTYVLLSAHRGDEQGSVAANAAAALATFGLDVLAVEGDEGATARLLVGEAVPTTELLHDALAATFESRQRGGRGLLHVSAAVPTALLRASPTPASAVATNGDFSAHYDLILIGGPSVMDSTVKSVQLASSVDGVVLLVCAGDDANDVESAAQLVSQADANVLGYVFAPGAREAPAPAPRRAAHSVRSWASKLSAASVRAGAS